MDDNINIVSCLTRDENGNDDKEEIDMEDGYSIDVKPQKKYERQNKTDYLGKALTISVAFAANAGGTGTLIGTAVNPILKGQADEYVINDCM